MLRVLLVDNHAERAAPLTQLLSDAGYNVIGRLSDTANLHDAVSALQPDVVIIDTESPSRDTLEHLIVMNSNAPRPIVMFTHDGDRDKIREATKAGVSAYVVGGLAGDRLRPIMDAAIARFEEFKSLRLELNEANSKLSERKVVEKAKGLLMKQRGISEDEAYGMLRNMAMKQNIRLATLAEQVVQAAKLLF
ncbi:ANTAR domain-containing response regulator [Methyloradius palustris]|uniref:Histidine kinase n=1 Tax=Methyloradius palustris TaxID=2778876 RepID=A0A8D5JXW1_9PROT|nr:ANTAR domain-containing protein [Methyloradius palustris]BCM24132.1 histidine kinase [Methyloradius palustris]